MVYKELAWKNRVVVIDQGESWRDIRGPGRSPQKVEPHSVVKDWSLLSSRLVASPNSSEFKHPLRQALLSEAIFSKWRTQQLKVLAMLVVVLLVQVVGQSLFGLFGLGLTSGLVILLGMVVWDRGNIQTPSQLADRSEFLVFTLSKKAHYILPSIFFGISLGMFFIWETGDQMVLTVGALPADIAKGELWRLVTGPLVHSGYQHLLINYVILAVAFPIACAASHLRPSIVLLSGAVASHVAFLFSNLLGYTDAEVLLGISGGVCALVAYTLVASFFEEGYPKGFWFIVFSLLMLLTVPSMLIESRTSNLAHVSGAGWGVLLYFLMKNRSPIHT